MTTKKLHVALLFGGNSSEHDVSKRSAHNIYDAMDKDKYDVSLFMFTTDGILLNNEQSLRIFNGEPEEKVVKEAYATMGTSSPLAPLMALNTVKDIDFFFPVIHGNLGEDGTVQGLFKLLKKPYAGCDIAASAIAFDKDLTKKICDQAGIRNVPYVLLTPENRDQYSWETVQNELGSMVFVKPANQGSSVGIHKVTSADEFMAALNDAFQYDVKVLVEKGIDHPQEIEISILGNQKPIASKTGAVRVPKGDPFYDYENKFVDASQVVFDLPAKIDSKLAAEITNMSLKAFRAMGMTGLCRFDFLVDSNNVPYLSEPNTMPGFTNISLYPQMWEVSGIDYSTLIDRIIKLGLAEFERKSKIKYSFKKLGTEKVGEKNYTEK